MLILQSPLTALVTVQNAKAAISLQVALHLGLLFTCCMICHGEHVRMKSPPRRLTKFYLAIASGGAFGACFVSIAAPIIFSEYYEYPIGVACCCILLLAVRRHERLRSLPEEYAIKRWTGFALVVALIALGLIGFEFALQRGLCDQE